MAKKSPRNVAASIHDRLLSESKKRNRPYEEILQYYALERFLYRLAVSPHRDKFVLKGALMFQIWKPQGYRPTRDIDFLGKTNNNPESLIDLVKEICIQSVQDDGMLYVPDSVVVEHIAIDAEYHGDRVTFWAKQGNSKVRMQLDVGFGDVVYPQPTEVDYPTLLPDTQAPRLIGYTMGSVIAEKFEAMVKLGESNSRFKDFYDVWHLMRQFTFDPESLAKAVNATFTQRRTDLHGAAALFRSEFRESRVRQSQWRAFLNKAGLTDAPEEFRDLMSSLETFLRPVIQHNSQLENRA
jgi:hypothetical protein